MPPALFLLTILKQGLTKFLGLALNLLFTPESPTTEDPTASALFNSWKASMWHKTGLLSYTNTSWVGGARYTSSPSQAERQH